MGTYTPLAKFLGHVTGQHFKAALERGVGCNARSGYASSGAGQIDDAGVFSQQRQQRLGEEERAFEMHIEQTIELRFADGHQGVEHAIAGVVDQAAQGSGSPGFAQGQHHGLPKPIEVRITLLRVVPVPAPNLPVSAFRLRAVLLRPQHAAHGKTTE
ncbi:hypothetical protein BKM20_26695 [Pseudomonas avellanae]|uniref:Uncharacterized protein n=1 Tax=Pseudomonas avellanae pv. morsprunorum TaxID=3380385 RepID=A0ABX4YQH0_9PSED|nr:hypothetical protein AL055_22985 [Pseudomonas amygdali pv. morsprunorum]PHN35491.1 hypothetical protein AO261_08580 [Pseudomonas avellanae]POC82546.1 hypothetical protein BKM26_26505 [Pseudomonas avellanae]POD00044.1 hypothetical protein BKM20_26695 [Pseudomonas avellanae]POD15324.1 hypothetical protein BKM05_25350 [Pseudomonas avellanae]